MPRLKEGAPKARKGEGFSGDGVQALTLPPLRGGPHPLPKGEGRFSPFDHFFFALAAFAALALPVLAGLAAAASASISRKASLARRKLSTAQGTPP